MANFRSGSDRQCVQMSKCLIYVIYPYTPPVCYVLYYLYVDNKPFKYIFIYFHVGLLSVLRGHSVFSSPPQRSMTSDFEGFSIPDCIHHIYFPILILEKEAVFPFLMFSAKQESYSGTIFITSLV